MWTTGLQLLWFLVILQDWLVFKRSGLWHKLTVQGTHLHQSWIDYWDAFRHLSNSLRFYLQFGMLTYSWKNLSAFYNKVSNISDNYIETANHYKILIDLSSVNYVRLAFLSNYTHSHLLYMYILTIVFFGCESSSDFCPVHVDSGSIVYQGKQSRRSWRAAATQNMDRAFTWPCALWVRQVAASSTGPPTWASHCCYCRRRHRSVCCRWEACRHKTTLTSLPTLGWVHPRAVGDCWHQFWATAKNL